MARILNLCLRRDSVIRKSRLITGTFRLHYVAIRLLRCAQGDVNQQRHIERTPSPLIKVKTYMVEVVVEMHLKRQIDAIKKARTQMRTRFF